MKVSPLARVLSSKSCETSVALEDEPAELALGDAAGDDGAEASDIGIEIKAVARAIVLEIDVHGGDVDAAKGQDIAGRGIDFGGDGGQGRGQGQGGTGDEAKSGQGRASLQGTARIS